MSMIDTWAATGAGAFSLSENGLYTIQGWARFLDRLTPSGVFTVSRWYAPNNVNETGRLVSLAKAALLELGIRDPAKQMFLVGHEQLSTLIVGRAPFTTEDIASLKQASARLGYHVLVSPDASVAAPLLHEIMAGLARSGRPKCARWQLPSRRLAADRRATVLLQPAADE